MSGHRSTGIVTFSETDASGRFHYTCALKWAENAEHEIYRDVGVPVVAFPRRTVSATFERPLTDGKEYSVELDVERLGTSSIVYAWRILADDHVTVTGSHAVVHINEAGRPTPLPDALRTRLSGLVTVASPLSDTLERIR